MLSSCETGVANVTEEPAEEIDTEEEGNGKAGWIYVTPEIPPAALRQSRTVAQFEVTLGNKLIQSLVD